jgi:uncharacterized protein (DUF1778 family)
MPTTEPKRLNLRVSDDTHYWLNIDAARRGQSLQGYMEERLDKQAAGVAEAFGLQPSDRLTNGTLERLSRPAPEEEGRKGGFRYSRERTPESRAMVTCDRE